MAHPIFQSAIQIEADIIHDRRTIHENPELSFQEIQTSRYISERLTQMNIQHKSIGTTGIVAIIGKGDYCVGLRADIDALPIHEETGLQFKSLKDGVMHACGHDAHTAMLLGAAKILKEKENELAGTVKLIFQPGEEKVPGGASILIKEGVLENPDVRVMFGQHVFPEATVGTVQMCDGFVMAAADELYWTIHGKGCHAAQPHLGNDPIYVASAIITHLQTLLTKTKNPLSPGQVTVTSIHGGSATNIVPESVEMKGTLRSFDAEWRETAISAIENHSKMIAEMHGCTAEVTVLRGYPAVVNNPETTSFAWNIANTIIGQDKVQVFEPKMWGEDFGFYAQKIPCTFWMLGVRPEGTESMPGLHNPFFAPDENAFVLGTTMLASAAIEWLQMKRKIA